MTDLQDDASAGLIVRPAERGEVAAIVAMIAMDRIGGHGDTDDPQALPDYLAAFDRISASPNDTLYVALRAGEVAGTFQTTLITTLLGRGASLMRVAAVHTRPDLRGRGIGAAMMRHAIEAARSAGAASVQLTSNAGRADAHRFYERLGFQRSHAGFKLKL